MRQQPPSSSTTSAVLPPAGTGLPSPLPKTTAAAASLLTLETAAKRELTPEQREFAIQTHMHIEGSIWRWWLRQGMENSIPEQAKSITLPVVVLASQDDPVIPFAAVQSDVIDILPNAELMTTLGVGHLIPLEDPAWLIEKIAAMLPD